MARAKTSTTSTTQTTGAAITAAPAPSIETNINSTTIVALNQPQSITFRLFKGEGDARYEYKRVQIDGNAVAFVGNLDAGKLPRGGYGFTTIDTVDWEEIKKQYGMLPLFKNGLIFAASSMSNAQAQAREQADLRSGFEPVDPEREALTSPDKSK